MAINNSIEFAQVTFAGRIGSEVTFKTVMTKKGESIKVASFPVAINHTVVDAAAPGGRRTASTTWINVSAWANLADLCMDLQKGQTVEIVADLSNVNSYVSTKSDAPAASLQVNATRIASSVWNSYKKQGVAQAVVDVPEAPEFV